MIRKKRCFPMALRAALLLFAAAPAAWTDSGFLVIPLARYELLSLESQTLHSPGTGVVVAGENLVCVGMYTRHMFGQDLKLDYPDTYHSIELVADGRSERHRYLAAFQSRADLPGAGGVRTFQAVTVYGYEVVQEPRFSLVLGGGLGINDFGIEMARGSPWPLLPVPLIRAAWESPLVNADLEFITGPNLTITLAPQSRLHATADARLDQLRDPRDLFFEGALVYRFLTPEHPLGDLASFAVGFKSDTYAFAREQKKESIELHYYALFATVDLALLKLSGGYAFDSRLRYRERISEPAGNGWFISVNVLYPFGGSHNGGQHTQEEAHL